MTRAAIWPAPIVLYPENTQSARGKIGRHLIQLYLNILNVKGVWLESHGGKKNLIKLYASAF